MIKTTALILAGGLSSRMGEDKSKLNLSNKALLERVLEIVAAVSQQTFIVTSRGRNMDWLPSRCKVQVVEDIYPGRGPLGGLYSGLKVARHEYCLAVGCDMPFIDEPLLSGLIKSAVGFDAAIAQVQAKLQPLPGIYSKRCIGRAGGLLASRNGGLHDLISDLKVRIVTEAELADWDIALTSFLNINTPSDFMDAKRLLELNQKDEI